MSVIDYTGIFISLMTSQSNQLKLNLEHTKNQVEASRVLWGGYGRKAVKGKSQYEANT